MTLKGARSLQVSSFGTLDLLSLIAASSVICKNRLVFPAAFIASSSI